LAYRCPRLNGFGRPPTQAADRRLSVRNAEKGQEIAIALSANRTFRGAGHIVSSCATCRFGVKWRDQSRERKENGAEARQKARQAQDSLHEERNGDRNLNQTQANANRDDLVSLMAAPELLF